MSLLDALRAHTATLQSATALCVGFSGGRDSHSLLHALVSLASDIALPRISALHVNHGLHSQSDQWAEHCRAICRDLSVEFMLEEVHVDEGPSLEAQARDARYAAFAQHVAPQGLLLLAHHLDDHVETVLFRLIRGAGARGLSGIRQTRALGEGQVFRPLLAVDRHTIDQYADRHALLSIEDASNADTRLDRNFLRHEVLPMIEARWPGYRLGFQRTSQIMAALDVISQEGARWSVCSLGCPSLDIESIDTEGLHRELYLGLGRLGLALPDFSALREFSRQCVAAPPDKNPELIGQGYVVWRWRGRLHVCPRLRETTIDEPVEVGTAIERDWGRLYWERAEIGLPVGLPMRLRAPVPGEKAAPLGRRARPLRQWLQESGVAPYWRDHVPLVSYNDHVVAVSNLGLSQPSQPITVDNNQGVLPAWMPPKLNIPN